MVIVIAGEKNEKTNGRKKKGRKKEKSQKLLSNPMFTFPIHIHVYNSELSLSPLHTLML